ncbi:amidase [Streptomyces sp. NPDC029554]|uniref:amidase n=1 Tax=Streptomyces sp. NPDC029554 TaxID=3155126 RepID=UPI0033FCBEC7
MASWQERERHGLLGGRCHLERRVKRWRPWSLRELVTALREGRTGPAQAVCRARGRIEETEADIRAWVALDDAPALTSDGALAGVPMGVKDIIDLAGFRTGCGSELRSRATPAARDAAIVAAWKSVGVIPLGKTVTTEFAFFAPGPTRNPVDLHHTPGGSSSGSAAAVAAGHVPLAIGSQTAGSVTRPAAYCGVASLVMCHQRFPMDGVFGLSHSLDAHGVFAATVDDLSLGWAGLTGDPDVGAEDWTAGVRAPRIAVWSADAFRVTREMTSAVTAVSQTLARHGAVVDAFPLGLLIADVAAAHPIVMAYEAAVERADEAAQIGRLSEPLANLLRSGSAISASEYEAARHVVAGARAKIADLLQDYDVILGPAALGIALRGHGATGDPVLSRPWQALGLAAVAVPGVWSGAGLPLGLQVISASELAALSTGVWVERRLRR